MRNYFNRYWHEIAISRIHSKVPVVIVLSLEIALHCFTTAKRRHIGRHFDVLIYLSPRRKTAPSLNSTILLLIDNAIVLYTCNFKLKCLQSFVTIQILASVSQSLNLNRAVLFVVSHLRQA